MWQQYKAAQRAYVHPVRRMMRLKHHGVTVHSIEKFKAQSEEILMRSVLNLCDSLLSLFF